ncbi:hypothetical protein J3369_10250 [Alteromonas sp. NFXS44]|uniref:hypothetical protein n=1 Tax=Alteromonas sp. NFXS44 TaxID=2818435 RepID=UPI0032DF7194
MKIEAAMDYAKHADTDKETVACLCKWRGKYCAFKLSYEVVEDEEPEDNGPRFSIEYVGGSLRDMYEVEGDTYTGADLDALQDDMIESVIDPVNLDFQIYPATSDAELIPYIYNELMPEYMPAIDTVKDLDVYQHQVDRVLHHLKQK